MTDDLNNKNMGELVELLSHNETAQYKIYNDYRQAADMDLTMRELKKEENLIRIYMSGKMGVS